MKPTRIWDLLSLSLLAAVATWLLLRVAYGSLPPIPVYAGASLYPVALIETILAFVVRSRVREHAIGDGPRQLHPITAARAVALAKASHWSERRARVSGQGFWCSCGHRGRTCGRPCPTVRASSSG